MVTFYAVFRTGTFGYRDIEENIEAYQTARQVLERIALDLKNSFNFSQDITGFAGNKNEIRFFSIVDNFLEGKVLKKYAFISYKLEEDKLMRLCRRDKEALNNNSEVIFEEFTPGIKEITFNYGEVTPPDRTILWKEEWNDNKVLPVAVKIKLILNNKTKQEFEKTVFFPLSL